MATDKQVWLITGASRRLGRDQVRKLTETFDRWESTSLATDFPPEER